MRIEIFKEDDRIAVAAILIKNGYTVRQGKERKEQGKSYVYFLDAEKPKEVK